MNDKSNIRWSKNIAYASGLITTDGNLSSDGRHFTFVSKDMGQIKTLKRCLGIKNKIVPKKSGYSNRSYYKVQFGNVRLHRWLSNIGLRSNKKYVAKLNIPDKYLADFLRGHIDGDGCLRCFRDPVYHNSIRIYTVFHSTNLRHLKWLRARIKKGLKIDGWIESTARLPRLTYAKAESEILLRYIYYGRDIPRLKRKYNLVKKFLNN
ncbi:MAG: hypothetical protein ABSB18_06245 [Candidatus Omnitrophota bacterium]